MRCLCPRCCRCVKSKARIINNSVQQSSRLSPMLFSFYIADMTRPTEPVRRICYVDDITVWASGVKNLGTRAKKLFDGDAPVLMGKLAFDISTKVISNLVYARPGAGQKETLLMTYKALGRSIANYAAPVWSTNASESNIGKIQRAQNEALRIITGSHKMSSIDHLHSEMLQVEDHLNLLSVQYLVQCLDTENVCHHITKMDRPPREMKETIFTRHYQTVLSLLATNRKDTLQALHASFVNTIINNMKDNRVLNNRPPSINDEETLLSRRQRTTHSFV